MVQIALQNLTLVVAVLTIIFVFLLALGTTTGHKWPYLFYTITVLIFCMVILNVIKGNLLYLAVWLVDLIFWTLLTVSIAPKQFKEIEELREKRKNDLMQQRLTIRSDWFE